ncbi:MAG: PorT family protein [Chitinivibrionales bacterium]|nr:PorT family protein [Chitinivibrionales bacterium]
MRFTSILFLSLFITLTANHYLYSSQMGFQVKMGINIASMYGAEMDELKNEQNFKKTDRKGFASGIALEIPNLTSMELLIFQPELFISSKGVSYSYNDMIFEKSGSRKLTYFEVPLLCKIQTQAKPVSLNFYSGLSPSISMKSVYELKTSSTSNTTTSDLIDETHTFDFGIPFGGGIDIDIGSGRVIIDLRYTIGIFDVYNNEANTIKNGVISLCFGYGIFIGTETEKEEGYK